MSHERIDGGAARRGGDNQKLPSKSRERHRDQMIGGGMCRRRDWRPLASAVLWGSGGQDTEQRSYEMADDQPDNVSDQPDNVSSRIMYQKQNARVACLVSHLNPISGRVIHSIFQMETGQIPTECMCSSLDRKLDVYVQGNAFVIQQLPPFP